MCYVTGADSRVSPDEIVAIAAARGQTVSAEAAAKLHERTQGWVAGLVLMLEHSRFSGRIVDLPGGATPQVIFDYLAGEIFDRFDPGTREFLLRIACLPRMTVEGGRGAVRRAEGGAIARQSGAERLLRARGALRGGPPLPAASAAARVPAPPRRPGTARGRQRRRGSSARPCCCATPARPRTPSRCWSKPATGARSRRSRWRRPMRCSRRAAARRSPAGSTCCRAR